MKAISQESAKELLDYDAHTGIFTWKHRKSKRFNTMYAGKQAGKGPEGSENRISLRKTDYSASRLAWLITYGEWVEDNLVYIDGDLKNCAISNLCKPDNKPQELTQDILKQYLTYDPDTGDFYWKKRSLKSFTNRTIASQWNNKIAGTKAATLHPYGYMRIKINLTSYSAHRIAWLYMTGAWPSEHIDHINHDRSDNRFINLREVTAKDNTRNVSLYKNNRSGVHGVGWCDTRRKWTSGIGFNNRHIWLGAYETLLDAAAARKAAEVKYGFHENHGQ